MNFHFVSYLWEESSFINCDLILTVASLAYQLASLASFTTALINAVVKLKRDFVDGRKQWKRIGDGFLKTKEDGFFSAMRNITGFKEVMNKDNGNLIVHIAHTSP
mgnify:CR=1 FL=1